MGSQKHHADTSNRLNALLTPRQVAERLTLSRTTLWRLTRTGELPTPISLSERRVAYREADIASFLDRRETAPDKTRARRRATGKAGSGPSAGTRAEDR